MLADSCPSGVVSYAHMSEHSTIDPVLTTEAARICTVSPETIREWERTGKLPALKTERGVRLFDRRDLLALKARRDQEHGAG